MHDRRRTISVAVLVALRIAVWSAASAAAVPAQASDATLEVGAARLRQRDVPATGAATAGVSLRREGARYALAAAGALTLADEHRSTTQGLLAASILGRAGRPTRWEIGGSLTTFDQGDLPTTAGVYLFAREHLVAGRLGGWAGVGVGGVEDIGWWSPTRSAELGVWHTSRLSRVMGGAVVVDTRSEPYAADGRLVTDPVTYTDASIGARWLIRRRVDIDVRGGLRFVSRGALTSNGRDLRSFAAADAALRLTPQLSVVAAVGRQLADLSRGTPDTRFAALALRFTLRDPAPTAPALPRRRVGPADLPRLSIVSDTTGLARLVVTAPHGTLVELAGTFTGWEPVALTRRGDRWELDRSIPSGAHRVVVRIDGGAWTVPANLPSTSDDLGGTVGILTIP